MRTIVIGDIHGCYDELIDLYYTLEEKGEYNKDTDKLIFLGDYIDRGNDSRLVIKFIRRLQEDNNNVIALMGNHEDMLLDYYRGIDDIWTFNGHVQTKDSYKGFEEQFKDDIQWMRTLPLYHEDEYFVYVHGGVDVDKPMEQQDKFTLLWIREAFINKAKRYHKRVIFGHTPTVSLSGKYEPICTFANNVDIDTGCVFGGALTALIIDDDEIDGYYQIDKATEYSYD